MPFIFDARMQQIEPVSHTPAEPSSSSEQKSSPLEPNVETNVSTHHLDRQKITDHDVPARKNATTQPLQTNLTNRINFDMTPKSDVKYNVNGVPVIKQQVQELESPHLFHSVFNNMNQTATLIKNKDSRPVLSMKQSDIIKTVPRSLNASNRMS